LAVFHEFGYHASGVQAVVDHAGVPKGSFYNHFKSKEALFSEAVSSFLMGRGAVWRKEAGIDMSDLKPEMAQQMVDAYLSKDHLGDIEGQCPMIALPSDVARADPDTQASFQHLLTAMVWLFENALPAENENRRHQALSAAAMCVGGMVLSRTLPSAELAEEVRSAAHQTATELTKAHNVSAGT